MGREGGGTKVWMGWGIGVELLTEPGRSRLMEGKGEPVEGLMVGWGEWGSGVAVVRVEEEGPAGW